MRAAARIVVVVAVAIGLWQTAVYAQAITSSLTADMASNDLGLPSLVAPDTPGASGLSATNQVATSVECSGTDIVLGVPVEIDGSGAEAHGSTVEITDGGTYCVTGELDDGKLVVDTSGAVAITLEGTSITNESGPAIEVADVDAVAIVLAAGSTNTLRDGETYEDSDAKGALFSNDSLVIGGSGTLIVEGRYGHGIAGDDDIVIAGGDIQIEAVKDGVHANDNITLAGGVLTVTDANDGLESEGDLVVVGGRFELNVADDGLVSVETLTINDGSITVLASFEGIESKNNIVVNGGSISVESEDDGLQAATDITINDGQLYVVGGTDAVDSNGTIAVNGGFVVATGATGPEGGLDCDRCEIEINGGFVVASGGRNGALSEASEQHVVVLGQPAAGSAIRIEADSSGAGGSSADGGDVLTYVPEREFQSLIFSSPDLTANTAYAVLAGGTVSGGEAVQGLYVGADFAGGDEWATFTTEEVVTYVGVDPNQGMPGGRPGGRVRP